LASALTVRLDVTQAVLGVGAAAYKAAARRETRPLLGTALTNF